MRYEDQICTATVVHCEQKEKTALQLNELNLGGQSRWPNVSQSASSYTSWCDLMLNTMPMLSILSNSEVPP